MEKKFPVHRIKQKQQIGGVNLANDTAIPLHIMWAQQGNGSHDHEEGARLCTFNSCVKMNKCVHVGANHSGQRSSKSRKIQPTNLANDVLPEFELMNEPQ